MNQTDASVLGAAWFSHLPSLLMCVSGLKEAVGRIKKMEGHLELTGVKEKTETVPSRCLQAQEPDL